MNCKTKSITLSNNQINCNQSLGGKSANVPGPQPSGYTMLNDLAEPKSQGVSNITGGGQHDRFRQGSQPAKQGGFGAGLNRSLPQNMTSIEDNSMIPRSAGYGFNGGKYNQEDHYLSNDPSNDY